MGVLLLSMVRIMQVGVVFCGCVPFFIYIFFNLQGSYLEGGFWFAVLLNLKHIFLYLSPAVFIYILKHYCFQGDSNSKTKLPSRARCFHFINFAKIGCVVVVVFMTSLGPFLYLVSLISAEGVCIHCEVHGEC